MFGRCKNCQFVNGNLATRDEMLDLFVRIRQETEVQKFTILEPNEEYQYGLADFLKMPGEPPFPDIIFIKISCNICNKKYRIFADWYHVKGQVSPINT